MLEIFKDISPSSFVVICVFAIVVVAVIIFAAVWAVKSKGKFKLKIGNTELGLSTAESSDSKNSESGTTTTVSNNNYKVDKDSFIPTIRNIINHTMDLANEEAVARQRLYSDQNRNTKSKFDMLKAMIIADYCNRYPSANISFLELILNSLIDSCILIKFEKAFQADRFAEKTKDQILDQYRSFIDSAYSELRLGLVKFRNSLGEDNKLLTQDILTCVDAQKDNIKRSIIDCFEYAHAESINYVNNIQKSKQKHSTNINNALKGYLSNSPEVTNYLPNVWSETMPPDGIVGV